MRDALALAALLGLTAVTAQESARTPASAAQPPMFRSHSSDLVVLPVTVTDGGGRLVSHFAPSHFVIYDEGRWQEIRAFSNEDHPVSIALVMDNSGSMLNKVGEVVAASLAFARVSHPEDDLHVIEFNDDVRDALDGRSLTAADTPELGRALRRLRPEGQTALYDAVHTGLDHLDEAAHTRRVLVLVSDGGDNASRATLDQVLDRARRTNVTIYAIGLYDENARDRNPGVLKRLTKARTRPGYLAGRSTP